MKFVIFVLLVFVVAFLIISILRWIIDVPGYFKKCADELESISSSLRALVEIERASLELERKRVALESTKSEYRDDLI